MSNVATILNRWPSVAEFARDIGVKATHAHVMKVRGSIPVQYWRVMRSAATGRGIELSLDELLEAHVPKTTEQIPAASAAGSAEAPLQPPYEIASAELIQGAAE